MPPTLHPPGRVRLVLTLLLASLPSALVVLDRWLARPLDAAVLYVAWDELLAGPFSPWPPYFLLALPAAFGAVSLAAGWPRPLPVLHTPHATPHDAPEGSGANVRRLGQGIALLGGSAQAIALVIHLRDGTRAGWDDALLFLVLLLGLLLSGMRSPPSTRILLTRTRRLSLPLAAHALLVAALATGYLHHPLAPLLAAAAVLAHVLLWAVGRRWISPAFWFVSLALIVSCIWIDGWWFAAIGDEYAFYDIASMVLARRPEAAIGEMLYNPVAVYGSHPGFSVLPQAASLALFGDNVFGWRFSSIYLAALSLLALYPFYRTFGRARFAALAVALLAVSHYLMSFSKIGYNNLQALFAFACALGTAAWVVRSRSRTASLACGLSLALSVYVFPAALLTLPVPLLYLAMFDPPSRQSRGRWCTMALVALAAALPMLVQPDWWATKSAGTIWNNPSIVASAETAISHVLTNTALAGMSFFFAPLETHFVAVGYLDALSSVFVLLGLGSLLQQGSTRPGRFLLAGLAILLVLVGALHDYPVPPTTRMFLVLPWFVLLAGMGIHWLVAALRAAGYPPPGAARWPAAILAAILVVNLLQAYPLSRLRMAARYQSTQVLFQHHAQALLMPGPRSAYLAILTPPDRPLRASLLRQLRLHRTPHDPGAILERDPAAAHDSLLADERALVLITADVPEAVRDQLQARLSAAGKRACRFRNSLGQIRLVVWLAPQEAGRCAGAATDW